MSLDGEFWMVSLDGWRVLDGEFGWMVSFGW